MTQFNAPPSLPHLLEELLKSFYKVEATNFSNTYKAGHRDAIRLAIDRVKRMIHAPMGTAFVRVLLYNPYTGELRNSKDIESDPDGLLIVDPTAPLMSYESNAVPKIPKIPKVVAATPKNLKSLSKYHESLLKSGSINESDFKMYDSGTL